MSHSTPSSSKKRAGAIMGPLRGVHTAPRVSPSTLNHAPPRQSGVESGTAQRTPALPVLSTQTAHALPSMMSPLRVTQPAPLPTTADTTATRTTTAATTAVPLPPLSLSPLRLNAVAAPLLPLALKAVRPAPHVVETPKTAVSVVVVPKKESLTAAVPPVTAADRPLPRVAATAAAVAAPSTVINGYEVPDHVQSAGGLQSLLFMIEHREDGAAATAPPSAVALDLADIALVSPTSPAGTINTKSNVRRQQQQQHGEPSDRVADAAVPMVQANTSARLAPHIKADGGAEDDWYDLASSDNDTSDRESDKASPDGDRDTTGATESAQRSDSLSSASGTSLSVDTASDSILLPTARRHSRSSEGSLMESIPFNNRVVMRQETDADLQCFHAYEYVLFFFEQLGHDVDEERSRSSSRSSQASHPSSRNRIAVVHGTDFQPKRSLRRIPTEKERRAAFVSRSLRDMYTNVARAYQVAGIPKGYLDALFMMEVLKGTKKARPRDGGHDGPRTAGDAVSCPSSDVEREVDARLRSTELVLADYDVDHVLQHAFRSEEARGRGGGERSEKASGKATREGPQHSRGGRSGKKGFSGGGGDNEERGRGRRRGRGDGPSPCEPSEPYKNTAAPRERAPQRPQQGSAHAFMLRVLQKNTLHFDYQHNAMALYTYRALRRSGNVQIHGKTIRLPIWEDEKSGYLATGVFDRTLGFPKNYKDPMTNEIYAEERVGGVAAHFPVPEMTRQHNAVNARCIGSDSGVTLRGCSIVRHPNVFGIYDGRVQGCQVAHAIRDHRRTGMHAAIQSLAHYMNLFPKFPGLARLLHPQDRFRYPVVNPVGGMYCVPLIINGAARLVKVDDTVPMDPVTGTFRCLTSNANELFPTLLEKALLKANGGGVTLPLMEPCQVLHQLCGWIPAVIPFVTDAVGNEVMWDGMLYAAEMWEALAAMYQQGRVAMSLVSLWEGEDARGTQTFVRRNLLSRPTRFTASASFPVVDVISRVESAEGRPVRRTRAVMLRDTTKDPTSNVFVPPVQTALSEAALSRLGYNTAHRDAGVFCVTWEEATTLFDHCSVSFCPATFWSKDEPKLRPRETTRICCHDTYDMSKEGKVMFHQPQYHLCFNNVESSTQVFVVYTQHTSMQHPLPWPCEGLANMTVDRISGGGAVVQLRVYEVTSLPSIQQVRREACGTPGRSCAFNSCVGRRLTCELEGPRPTRVVASALGRANAMITIDFDVAPGTREYVLVLDVEADASTDVSARITSFPYTMTLYTSMGVLEQANPSCLPFVAPRGPSSSSSELASAAQKADGSPGAPRARLRKILEGGGRPPRPPAPTATMHAMPTALQVNARTVHGVWGTGRVPKQTAIVKHDLVTEELWTGPQFHLHLRQPDEFFIRLYATSPSSSSSPAEVAVKLLLVRKTTRKNFLVAGYVMGQSDLVLVSSGWSKEGAVLDSFSPHTVLLDQRRELLQAPVRTRREYKAVINVVLYLDPEDEVKEASCLLVRHPDPADCVQSLVVRAFAQGMLISPHACRASCKGNTIPLSTAIHELLADRAACYTFNPVSGESMAVAEEEGSQSYACCEPCLDFFVDVEFLNTAPFMAIDFPENELSGSLVTRLRTVARQTLISGAQQRTRALRAISHISTLIHQSGLSEEKSAFLLGIARGLADWCTARASTTAAVTRSSPLMLGQLPAGDYTVVTCFNPTAGAYSRSREDPRCPPKLKRGGDVEFDVSVELLRQRVVLTEIAVTVDPASKQAASHTALLNEFTT